MTGTERFVVLGLAPVRAEWFRDVSRWATAAALPLEFLKAVSVEEVRVRLRSGRSHSALLIDGSISGLDRDLIDVALEVGAAVIVVGPARSTRWTELGASAHLPAGFTPAELHQVLTQVARPVARTGVTPDAAAPPSQLPGYRGRLVAVTGAGGSGRSTVAMALAQGVAGDPRHAGLVCLADLALHADHAMLHDARDVVPGVSELVDAHRTGTPTVEAVRALTWFVQDRGYHLLLGLRRHREWTSIRPRAFEASLSSLRRGFRIVIADIDDDLEGERLTGSLDVEERNTMARTVAEGADLVVVVGTPGPHGLHTLLRVTRDLLDHGVAGRRLLPVVNRSPRSPRARAELTRSFNELLAASGSDDGVPGPVFLAERRNLDAIVRDGRRLRDAWLDPLATPTLAILDALDEPPTAPIQPTAVAPGSLGRWTEQDDDHGLAAGASS